MGVLDRWLEGIAGERTLAREEFERLLAAHEGEVFRRARILVGHGALAEDVLQQVMVEALASYRRYDPARPIGPWLAGIVLNVARRHWRRARRTREAERRVAASEATGGGPTPEGESAARERVERLYAALDRLSPVLRETFLLRAVDGLDAEVVAELTGATVGAVHTRLCRARDALREALEGPDGGRGEGTP